MFNKLKVALLFALSSTALVSSSPVPEVEAQTARLFIGWKGLQQGSTIDKKNPIRGGGQLGHVFYVADDTDLARFFSGTHVCEITVDAKLWMVIQKRWLTHQEAASGSDAVDGLYPGQVIFAAHDPPPQGDPSPWQMGIRLEAFRFLDVDGICYPKTDPRVQPGKKLDYSTLTEHWGIKGHPERFAPASENGDAQVESTEHSCLVFT